MPGQRALKVVAMFRHGDVSRSFQYTRQAAAFITNALWPPEHREVVLSSMLAAGDTTTVIHPPRHHPLAATNCEVYYHNRHILTLYPWALPAMRDPEARPLKDLLDSTIAQLGDITPGPRGKRQQAIYDAIGNCLAEYLEGPQDHEKVREELFAAIRPYLK